MQPHAIDTTKLLAACDLPAAAVPAAVAAAVAVSLCGCGDCRRELLGPLPQVMGGGTGCHLLPAVHNGTDSMTVYKREEAIHERVQNAARSAGSSASKLCVLQVLCTAKGEQICICYFEGSRARATHLPLLPLCLLVALALACGSFALEQESTNRFLEGEQAAGQHQGADYNFHLD